VLTYDLQQNRCKRVNVVFLQCCCVLSATVCCGGVQQWAFVCWLLVVVSVFFQLPVEESLTVDLLHVLTQFKASYMTEAQCY
jgi:hypothetical protein